MGPRAIWREDLITSLLSVALVTGLFLDGWNHINLQNGALGSFFTIWHALLYTGFSATFAWVVTRNPHLFVAGSLPAPYLHRFLGIPLRYPLAMAGFVIAVAAFMFQWLSAFLDWTPSITLGRTPPSLQADVRVLYTAEFAAVARVLATNVILFAPLLLALRRWQLPFGSATFLLVVVSAAMSGLATFDLGLTVVAALVGGLLFDTIVAVTRPDPSRTFGYRAAALIVPFVMWPVYFAILWGAYGIVWPFDLALGTVGLASISTVLLSYVAISPAVPVTVGQAALRAPESDTSLATVAALPIAAAAVATTSPRPATAPVAYSRRS